MGVAELGGEFAVADVEDGACFAPAGVHFYCYVEVWKCKMVILYGQTTLQNNE